MHYIIGTEKRYLLFKEELQRILPKEICNRLQEKVRILDESYGSVRDLVKDLGGYCVIFPTVKAYQEEYQEILNKHSIEKELYEYREQIEEDGTIWIEELYLLSSDYGMVLFYPEGKVGEELC